MFCGSQRRLHGAHGGNSLGAEFGFELACPMPCSRAARRLDTLDQSVHQILARAISSASLWSFGPSRNDGVKSEVSSPAARRYQA